MRKFPIPESQLKVMAENDKRAAAELAKMRDDHEESLKKFNQRFTR